MHKPLTEAQIDHAIEVRDAIIEIAEKKLPNFAAQMTTLVQAVSVHIANKVPKLDWDRAFETALKQIRGHQDAARARRHRARHRCQRGRAA